MSEGGSAPRPFSPEPDAIGDVCARTVHCPAFATVQGMIRLADDHGGDRLDALCAEALDLNRLASGFLRERVKNGGEPDPPRPEHDETIPSHGNIRGGDYYGNNGGATP